MNTLNADSIYECSKCGYNIQNAFCADTIHLDTVHNRKRAKYSNIHNAVHAIYGMCKNICNKV